MKKVEIEINGQRVFGAVAQSGSTTWYSLGGEVWTVEAETRSHRGAAKAGAIDPSLVKAPMPGKIVKVFSKVGAEVKAGETLVVMEAMKMEYTLKASGDGSVEEIQCAAGQQVTLGSVLVKLKIAAGKA